jgi:hypothetical protein
MEKVDLMIRNDLMAIELEREWQLCDATSS